MDAVQNARVSPFSAGFLLFFRECASLPAMRTFFSFAMAFLLSASCTHCKSRTCHCPAKEADLTNSPARADAGDAAPMRPKPVVNRVEEPQCPAGWKAPEETAQAHRIAHAFLPFPWKVRAVFRAGARITARPARLAGDRWILADHRGRVRAIDIRKANGRWSLQEAWKAQLPDIVWSAPKVSADGRSLWVGCDDDSVYRLDAATGKVLGQVRPFECTFTRKNDPEATRCDVDNEFVLLPDASVLAGGGGIARILPDGTIAWRFPVTSHVRGAPAVDGEGHLYFSTLGGEIVSLDAQGALRWRERVRSRCDSTPVLAGGCLVILGCDDSSLNAFSTLDGRPVWKLFAPGAFRGAGALSPDGSVLYWGGFDRHLYAVETATGKVRWRYRTSGRHLGAPLVDAGGHVLVFPEENRGYWLDAEGHLRGTLDLPAIADAPPAFVDEDAVLLALETGDVLLLAGADK